MTSGIINATNVVILADFARIAALSSAELSVSRDLFDITTKDSAGWNQVAAGKMNWELSGEGKLSFEENKNFAYVENLIKDKTKIKVLFGVENDANDQLYIGDAYITAASLSAGVEDAATFSFSMKGTGNLKRTNIIFSFNLKAEENKEFVLPGYNEYFAFKIEWNNNQSTASISFLETDDLMSGYSYYDYININEENGFVQNITTMHKVYQKIALSSTSGNYKIVVYGNLI